MQSPRSSDLIRSRRAPTPTRALLSAGLALSLSLGGCATQQPRETSAYSQITFNAGVVPTGATAAFIEFSQAIGPIGTGAAGENLFAGKVLIDDINLQIATPVPEPETNALMLAGLGVIGFIVRRRRRSV